MLFRSGELNSYKNFAAFLEPYKKGWEMAVDEVNAAGGVLGRKIEIVSRDDNGNPADAVRVAEGGVEHLVLSRTTDLADSLKRLRERGVRVLGADMAGAKSSFGFCFDRPCVLVLGNEREGLSDRVLAQCDATVAIPGTGAVESLNVAIAASILVAELSRGRFSP